MSPQVPELVDPLFRREAGRMVAALTRVLGAENLSLAEIARAYLAKEATIAQRLVRAKRKIQEIRPPFEVPPPAELPAALDSVLEALYLMFNEGYAAAAGEELVRQEACAEAVRLVRLVAEHPALDLPKAHALAALLLLQAARNPARVDPEGNLLLLSEQDRSLWDRSKIAAGFHHLDRAARGSELSVYHLEAAIAACHVTPGETDWPYILDLYGDLLALKPSPVVALNRAVALAMVEGPAAGIRAVEEIRDDPALAGYYPLPVTLGELYARAGDAERAAACFREALEMESPEPVRRRVAERVGDLEKRFAFERVSPL